LQSELSASTSRVQRLETQLKQVQSGGDRKAKDFEVALKARDEAVRETGHLQQLIDALQEKERQRVTLPPHNNLITANIHFSLHQFLIR